MSDQWPGHPIQLPFRVADQHQATRVHQPLTLDEDLEHATTVRIDLPELIASIELPDGELAQSSPMAEESGFRIWSWPSGDRLQLAVDRSDDRIALMLLERRDDRRSLMVAGAPMLVELMEQGDPERYVAHVRGYIDDWTTLHAAVWAGTRRSRTRLLASVRTLQLHSA